MQHYYTSPELSYSRNLTADEYSKLIELVNQPGWVVFMQLKRHLLTECVEVAMADNPLPEDQRAVARGIYKSLSEDLAFVDMLEGLTPTTDREQND